VLLGGVALLLVITAVNVTHVVVLQAMGRRRDRAIQRAIGASGSHLLRQRSAYALLIATLGGGGGVLTAYWLVELLKLLPADQIPRLGSLAIGPPAWLLAAGITMLCTLLILFAGGGIDRRGQLVERLRSHEVGGGRATQRRRALLVVVETALAVALLVGTGLLAQSLLRLQAVDPGFDPSRLAAFDLSMPGARYPEPAQAARFLAEYGEQLEALPGVLGVGAMSRLPLENGRYQISVSEIDGIGPATPADEQLVEVRVTTPKALDLLGVPLVAGRWLDAADSASAPRVALVNEAAARQLWPNREPLGHRLTLGTRFGLGGERAGGEVVGVVEDLRDEAIDAPARPTVYLSHAQFPLSSMSVLVATAGDPVAVIGPARDRLQQLDPELALAKPRSVESLLDAQLLEPRLYAFLLGLFALAALGLTALGLYGTIAFAVERRRREIGLRMALGADRGKVLRMVLRGAGALAFAGIAGGLAVSLLLGRTLAGLLYEIRPADPSTLIGVALLTALIALAASLLPARRATRLDPIAALRSE